MSQTIAAIATPPLPSAIGILRLSGDGAIEAAAAVFRPASGKSLAEYESRRLVYGTLLGPDGAPIDQALATISRAPAATPGRTRRSFSATARRRCSSWGWKPCLPRECGRPGRGSSPGGPSSTASWI